MVWVGCRGGGCSEFRMEFIIVVIGEGGFEAKMFVIKGG